VPVDHQAGLPARQQRPDRHGLENPPHVATDHAVDAARPQRPAARDDEAAIANVPTPPPAPLISTAPPARLTQVRDDRAGGAQRDLDLHELRRR
jgi:hypothetical protein